jgi:hypothetical protein
MKNLRPPARRDPARPSHVPDSINVEPPGD